MSALGHNLTEGELQEALKGADLDGNGSISFSEFVTIMAETLDEFSEDELTHAFLAMDKDGNGTVNAAELKEVMTRLGRHSFRSLSRVTA